MAIDPKLLQYQTFGNQPRGLDALQNMAGMGLGMQSPMRSNSPQQQQQQNNQQFPMPSGMPVNYNNAQLDPAIIEYLQGLQNNRGVSVFGAAGSQAQPNQQNKGTLADQQEKAAAIAYANQKRAEAGLPPMTQQDYAREAQVAQSMKPEQWRQQEVGKGPLGSVNTAIERAGDTVKSIVDTGKSVAKGKPAGFEKITIFDQDQDNLIKQYITTAMATLKDPMAGFDPYAKEATRHYNEEVVPGILEGFQGRISSPALGLQLRSGAQGLESMLNAQRVNYGQQNIANALSMGNLGLTPRYNTQFNPGTEGLAGPASQLATTLFLKWLTGGI